MVTNCEGIISSDYDLADLKYRQALRRELDLHGAVTLPGFIDKNALDAIRLESTRRMREAYFCVSEHNVYLTPNNRKLSQNHPHNRQVISSKGLIADDQISHNSPLKILYRDADFQAFIAEIVGEPAIFPYADPLSAVNVHYAKTGQQLGWHFDNSSFAITLLIDKPDGGGEFEYVKDVRNADAGEMNFEAVGRILDGKARIEGLTMNPGTLVLFRGRNSIHRVTPTTGPRTRMLAVLAYNSKPGVELCLSARQTFYGRLV